MLDLVMVVGERYSRETCLPYHWEELSVLVRGRTFDIRDLHSPAATACANIQDTLCDVSYFPFLSNLLLLFLGKGGSEMIPWVL